MASVNQANVNTSRCFVLSDHWQMFAVAFIQLTGSSVAGIFCVSLTEILEQPALAFAAEARASVTVGN